MIPKSLGISNHVTLNLHHRLQIWLIAELRNDITHEPIIIIIIVCINYIIIIIILWINLNITLVTKSGFRELLIHSVRQISFHLEISGDFIYTTHIGSDFENTSQSNKFLKYKTFIYWSVTIGRYWLYLYLWWIWYYHRLL